MTEDDFRSAVLGLPGTSEGMHMGHPDFRVKGRIFATLYWAPVEDAGAARGRRGSGAIGDGSDDIPWGMVKLTPAQQRAFIKMDGKVFSPVKGGWGKQGCTRVRLGSARRTSRAVREAIAAAWSSASAKK